MCAFAKSFRWQFPYIRSALRKINFMLCHDVIIIKRIILNLFCVHKTNDKLTLQNRCRFASRVSPSSAQHPLSYPLHLGEAQAHPSFGCECSHRANERFSESSTFRWAAVKRFNKMSAYMWKYDPHTSLPSWNFGSFIFFASVLHVNREENPLSFTRYGGWWLAGLETRSFHPPHFSIQKPAEWIERRKHRNGFWWKWNGSTPRPRWKRTKVDGRVSESGWVSERHERKIT